MSKGYGKTKVISVKRKRELYRILRVTLIGLLIVVIITLPGLAAVVSYSREIKSVAGNLSHPEEEFQPTEAATEDGVTNILVLGTDKRKENTRTRSDMIMIVSISTYQEKISLISLQRDLYLEIPGHGSNKLNAAYAIGGAELMVETIEANFDLLIDDYIIVDMNTIYPLLDACGGSLVDIKKEEVPYINNLVEHYNKAVNPEVKSDLLDEDCEGLTLLNGIQAIAYARVRYLDSDFGRTARQRKAVFGVLANWKAMLKEGRMGELLACYNRIPGCCDCILTSMNEGRFRELTSLTNMLRYLQYEMNSEAIPAKGTWTDEKLKNGAIVTQLKSIEAGDGSDGLKENKALLKSWGCYGIRKK